MSTASRPQSADDIDQPTLVSGGRVRVASLGDGPHVFGGPLDLAIESGLPEAPALHRVLTLDLSDPSVGIEMPGVAWLPLVYGFLNECCEMTYRVHEPGRIEVLDWDAGDRADDWPYAGYPTAFPAARLAWADRGAIRPGEIDDLTPQGLDAEDPTGLAVVIVPSSDAYGVSLWDAYGEGVQVIFEVHAESRTVTVYNQRD